MRDHPHEYILENSTIATLTYSDLLKHSANFVDVSARGFFDIHPQRIDVNVGVFTHSATIFFTTFAEMMRFLQ